jgi:hypothetical protein
MCMYSQRTQVLLSPEQLARLKGIAAREGQSVGAVIRDAVDAFTASAPASRERAIRSILSMEAPVEDWAVMKEQILRSQLGGG